MPRSQLLSLALSAVFAFAFAGCSTDSTTSENSGSLNLNLELAPGVTINEVDWTISGGEMEDMTGTIDTSAPGATASVEVFGLPPGDGYTVTLEATDESGEVSCKGDAEFAVEVGVSTDVMVFLNCKIPTNLGGVRVNGKFNICAQVAKVVVSPLQTSVGNEITLSAQAVDTEGDDVSFEWTASGGSIADASAADTSYTCGEVGEQSITITVSDDPECMDDWTVAVTCVEGDGGMGGSGGDGGAGGEGGMGGEGGAGGEPAGSASVTAAHFAPEIPSAEDTAVAIYVNGEEVTALGTIEYGETTGRVALPAPGTYDIGIGLPGGDGPLLELSGVELSDGDDIAAAAYRTNEALPVALFAYNLSTDGLEAGSGRVYVSHGANDPLLDPVDIIVTDEGACPPPLLDELAFGETRAEGGIDLPATSYNLGFDLAPGDCTAEVPFVAPVTEAVTSILVAVDEDTGPGLAPQVWALVDAETVVALITPNPCDNVVCEDTDCTSSACNPDTGACDETPINEGGDCESGTGTCETGMCVDKCLDVVCEEIECNVNACDPFMGECAADPVEDGNECTAGGSGGDIADNGGFETGTLEGWTLFCEGLGTCEATQAEANTGAWSGRVVTAGAPANPLIKQANKGIGAVQPNSEITISFSMKGSLAGASGVVFAELFSEIIPEGVSQAEILGGGPLFPTDQWVDYSFTTTTGPDVSNGVTLQLAAICGAVDGCVVEAFFDDVTIVIAGGAGEPGTCSEGVCVPNPECSTAADCPDDGNECTDALCDAGTCGTSNNTNVCDGGAGTCDAGVCVPNAETLYNGDFEALDAASAAALSGDGWLASGNQFDSDGNFVGNFGTFPAPNAAVSPDTTFYSAVVQGQGGPAQGNQQLSILNDYNCCGTTGGHKDPTAPFETVEALVFQEPFNFDNRIPAELVGQTVTFFFEGKKDTSEFGLGGNTTAQAFMKTLDPNAGFATTRDPTLDTTSLPLDWAGFSLSLDITSDLEGQILQVGFQTLAQQFEPSNNFYDNIMITVSPTP